ncbi:DUF4412 domain-containing protein, partial [candidate division KSB3 bacterium]|nr:DUF4412 domain-containing protein [candidate division KSB3 bacterium]MBD3326332.1 DUF4412 domain-containing protein [candidate division KSB3 bacterium]
MKKGIGYIMISVICLFMLTSAAYAGWYWETERTIQGMPGQPDGTTLVKNYYTADAARQEDGRQVMIMDFTNMTVYQLNPSSKTYTQFALSEMGMPGMSPQEQQQMMQQMDQMMGDITVTPTGKTQTISGYPCEQYVMDMGMMMNAEYWLTTDIENYEELQAIGEKVAAQFESIPMFGQMN